MAARVEHSPQAPNGALDRTAIAASLVGRRDRLVRQLPRQIKLARRLTADQCELVVDEAVDWLVTENDGVVPDAEALEHAFWTVADLRVRRAFEGRQNTVRAGWKRVSVDDVEVPDDGATPEDAVIRGFERETLEEFAAELSPEERGVLAIKYSGPKELGRFEIARMLGRKPYEIRRSERSIARKLKWFSAIVAAGKLCHERHASVEALAYGHASDVERRVAHAHLERCQPCRTEYKHLLRAIKSGDLQRDIGQILPAPAIDAVERHRGPFEIVVDWLSRPFGHDATVTAAQLGAAGRGVSTLAGAKLLGLCVAGTASLGGGLFCISQIADDAPPKPRALREAPARATPERATPAATVVTASTPVRTADRKRPKKKSRKGGEVSRDATSHEKAAVISPPATAPGGEAVSEFEPGPATSAPSRPAAAPANGAPEFP